MKKLLLLLLAVSVFGQKNPVPPVIAGIFSATSPAGNSCKVGIDPTVTYTIPNPPVDFVCGPGAIGAIGTYIAKGNGSVTSIAGAVNGAADNVAIANGGNGFVCSGSSGLATFLCNATVLSASGNGGVTGILPIANSAVGTSGHTLSANDGNNTHSGTELETGSFTPSGSGTINANVLGSAVVYVNSNTTFAANVAGASADAKITAAIATLPSGGGTVDATGLTGPQSWNACPTFGSNPLMLRFGAGKTTLGANCTFPANVVLDLSVSGAMLDPSTFALVINGSYLAGPLQQIFPSAPAGTITVSNQDVYAAQFGADVTHSANSATAINTALSAVKTGTVYLNPGEYVVNSQINKRPHQWLRGTQATGSIIDCTGLASGAACIADADVLGSGIQQFPEGGIENVMLFGNGSGSGTVGIFLGGDAANVITPSTYYGFSETFRKVIVRGFGNGVQYGNNAWQEQFEQILIQSNNIGVQCQNGLSDSGEMSSFYQGSISNNNVGVNDDGGGAFTFVGTNFDFNVTQALKGNWAVYNLFGVSIQVHAQSGANAPIKIQGASGFLSTFISIGSTLVEDGATGTDSEFFNFTNAFVVAKIEGGQVYTNHTVTNLVTLASGATLVTPSLYPVYLGTAPITSYSTALSGNTSGCVATQNQGGKGALCVTTGSTINIVAGSGTIEAIFGNSSGPGIALPLGNKYQCVHGTNGTCGVVTLTAGAATISTTSIAALAAAGGAGDAVILQCANNPATTTITACATQPFVSAVTPGTSFVIGGTLTDTVYWEIKHVN